MTDAAEPGSIQSDGNAAPLGLDPEQLRARYRHERDRRLRDDGEEQFAEVTTTGSLAEFVVRDPYAPPPPERDAITDDVTTLIVGGGWVGLIAAARLREAGVDDFRIVDGGADFGGTWYWNRYPGCQCDVESYIYLPLLEQTGYIPKERYSHAPEIFEHAQRIANHFDLYPKAIFQTWVTSMAWDGAAEQWIVETNRGDRMRAKFVSLGTGPFSRPRLPGIPGIDEFHGPSFHTSRWDYSFTGGGPDEPMGRLADKRVAVIGTGATGIQCIPPLAESAEHLFVFQRTPSAVDQRNNADTDPEWSASLSPGWQRERQRRFNELLQVGVRLLSGKEVLVDDEFLEDNWARMVRNILSLAAEAGDLAQLDLPARAELAEMADFATMDELRRRVDETIEDPERAEQLKAWYRQFCKRPTFSDEFLPTFNRANVTLVDVSDSKGVERITKRGVVANGEEFEVDCIIFATGFEVTSDYHRRLGIEIAGEGGLSLYDYWSEGMRTFHGHSVHGFPNLFLVGGLFAFFLSPNYCSVVDDQAAHVAYIIKELTDRGVSQVQPTLEAEEAWIERLAGKTGSGWDKRMPSNGSCTPGYYNREGQRIENRSFRREQFADGANAFTDLLASWRAAGDLAGLDLR